MQIQSLGHAVVNVRDLDRSEHFYHDILGLPIVTRAPQYGMTFFALRNHHDFAIRSVGPDAAASDGMEGIGLFHVAFCIGDSLEQLREARDYLQAQGVPIGMTADHEVTASLYIRDPDGNGIELYVDQSDSWKRDGTFEAVLKPLAL